MIYDRTDDDRVYNLYVEMKILEIFHIYFSKTTRLNLQNIGFNNCIYKFTIELSVLYK